MSSKVDLKLDWCSHKGAKFACENWHYSRCMPSGKTAKIGVWENGKFIGCVIYALGANASISNFQGMKTAELARVALTKHITPVTRIVAISIKILQKTFPKLELLISYADRDRGHEGGIYKGGNWVYTGLIVAKWIKLNGKITHPRSINAKYGSCSLEFLRKIDKNVKRVETKGKHRFLYPLHASVVEQVKRLATS